MKLIKEFLRDERGLESMEYAILAALLVVGLVAILTGLKDEIGAVFNTVRTELQNAQPAP
jgi:Flp pilus assembly pilin Flp